MMENWDIEAFFSGKRELLPLFFALRESVQERFAGVEIRVQKSQISFCDPKAFLYVSRPVYARGAAGSSKRGFTVSFGLWEKLQSERILFVAHPTEKWWIHHLFLSSQGQIDAELMGWVEQAHALRQWGNGRKF